MGHMNGGHLPLVRVENGRRFFDSSELIKSFGNEFDRIFQEMIVPYRNAIRIWNLPAQVNSNTGVIFNGTI